MEIRSPGDVGLGMVWGVEGLRIYAGMREEPTFEDAEYNGQWLGLFSMVYDDLQTHGEELIQDPEVREQLTEGYKSLANFAETLLEGSEVDEEKLDNIIEEADSLASQYHDAAY